MQESQAQPIYPWGYHLRQPTDKVSNFIHLLSFTIPSPPLPELERVLAPMGYPSVSQHWLPSPPSFSNPRRGWPSTVWLTGTSRSWASPEESYQESYISPLPHPFFHSIVCHSCHNSCCVDNGIVECKVLSKNCTLSIRHKKLKHGPTSYSKTI